MSLDKDVLRTVKEKSEEKIIPYVSTHNPQDPEMFKVILDNVPILKEDDKMRNILTKYKLIKSKRQPYNLKRLLTKAKFTSNNTPKVTKCNKPTCGLCIHLLEGHSFTFRCGKKFTIHENMSFDVKKCGIHDEMQRLRRGNIYIDFWLPDRPLEIGLSHSLILTNFRL